MRSLKQHLSRRLGFWETLVVLVCIALLGGLSYGAYLFVGAKILEARVNAALPPLCAAVRQQEIALVRAIEAYRAQFGVYPSDHLLCRQPLVIDPITNTLLYELAGVLYNPANKTFQAGNLEPADAAYVTNFFQCAWFRNSSHRPEELKHFLTSADLPSVQLHDDPDVFALGFTLYPPGIDGDLIYELRVSPWRYNARGATHNPGKFDLWLEVATRNKRVVIGNWAEP